MALHEATVVVVDVDVDVVVVVDVVNGFFVVLFVVTDHITFS